MVGIYLSGTGNTKHCVEKLVYLLDDTAKIVPLENTQITNILERIINKMNISLMDDVTNSFKTSGKVDSKELKLSNGHPIGTETGFISPIILAILTATIEIIPLIYIFLNTME